MIRITIRLSPWLYRHTTPRQPALTPLQVAVRLPAGHPEGWTSHPDEVDVHLADLLDREWPQEEYLAVQDCPRWDLDPWESRNLAIGAIRRARRERGRLRCLLWRPHHCACGSWHATPFITSSPRETR